jgi:hypothetical protein
MPGAHSPLERIDTMAVRTHIGSGQTTRWCIPVTTSPGDNINRVDNACD